MPSRRREAVLRGLVGERHDVVSLLVVRPEGVRRRELRRPRERVLPDVGEVVPAGRELSERGTLEERPRVRLGSKHHRRQFRHVPRSPAQFNKSVE